MNEPGKITDGSGIPLSKTDLAWLYSAKRTRAASVGVEAYAGLNVDHLFRDCPSLKNTGDVRRGPVKAGDLLVTEVDPYGTDICGLCAHRYH